jgi:dienelactone hydrolase
VEDPSRPGSFAVGYFTYGAGPNKRRPEFGEERDWESRTVNATPLLKEWKGLKKRMREWYWGFGLDAAPLNALVWAPEGDGPFPLVLIVHGNHNMEEYSDPGYAYLGELLASRGFIAVSVDENTINGTWSGDFRGKEMPLRAWFLLEHLKLWREWNRSATHPYSGKVDMTHIALVGHSRGGEAVSMAFAYNGLSHYPDDATITFDYGFDIKSLVAIAQVDQRYHRRVELENVSFLTLHGSYDSDEPAYHGMRQFNRISLNDDNYWFKTGIYIHRANHGQFNSIWGREDMGPPGAWLLNLKPIIPPEDQRQIAKVYIAAFLEATLKNDRRYVPLFRDPRRGVNWLPDHAFVHQFTDSTFIPIADFDEDLDVTTGSASGATISAESFTLWREEDLEHRDERQQGTHAVVLGWKGDDPVYSIRLPESFWERIETEEGLLLTFSVSGSTEKPSGDKDEDQDKKRDLSPFPPAFTLEVEDGAGRIARVRSGDYANLAPPLRVQYLKPESLNKERYKSEWEPVLQAFEVPLSVFAAEGDGWQVSDIRFLRFRFDQASEGVVILDDIGIRRPVAE